MRIVSIIMFILLLLCVAVQYNDPDPYTWAIIYAIGAAVTWPAVRGRYTVWALITFVGYTFAFLYWMPNEMVENPSNLLLDLQMHEKGVEEVREDIGLFICAAWMLVLTIMWWRTRNKIAPASAPQVDEIAGKAE